MSKNKRSNNNKHNSTHNGHWRDENGKFAKKDHQPEVEGKNCYRDCDVKSCRNSLEKDSGSSVSFESLLTGVVDGIDSFVRKIESVPMFSLAEVNDIKSKHQKDLIDWTCMTNRAVRTNYRRGLRRGLVCGLLIGSALGAGACFLVASLISRLG